MKDSTSMKRWQTLTGMWLSRLSRIPQRKPRKLVKLVWREFVPEKEREDEKEEKKDRDTRKRKI